MMAVTMLSAPLNARAVRLAGLGATAWLPGPLAAVPSGCPAAAGAGFCGVTAEASKVL